MLRLSQARSLVYLRDRTEAGRPAFERRLDRPIRELAADGSVHTAGQRDRYVVVADAGFATTGRSLDGVDVLDQPGRRETIERAEGAGSLAATGSVALAHNGERGTIIFSPVRTGGGERGFVAGTFNHSVVFDAIRHALASDVALRVSTGGTLVGERAPARLRPRPVADHDRRGRTEREAHAAAPGDPRRPAGGGVRGVADRLPRRALRAREPGAGGDHRAAQPARLPAPARRADRPRGDRRGDADRPRPLQGDQRHPRPPRRRPGHPRRRRRAALLAARRRHRRPDRRRRVRRPAARCGPRPRGGDRRPARARRRHRGARGRHARRPRRQRQRGGGDARGPPSRRPTTR